MTEGPGFFGLIAFLAGLTVAHEVDGIYPVSGGTGLITIYGTELETVTDVRFRSELIQGSGSFRVYSLCFVRT